MCIKSLYLEKERKNSDFDLQGILYAIHLRTYGPKNLNFRPEGTVTQSETLANISNVEQCIIDFLFFNFLKLM